MNELHDRLPAGISSGSAISRRTLLQSAGGLVALAGFGVAGGAAFAAAQETILGTPPVPVTDEATLEAFGTFGPTIASKAAELGYDLEMIFRFVADEVRYEPYAGALRGANGTLWGLAGNSVDKSLLLAALLDASRITWRFAIGPLADEAAPRVIGMVAESIGTISQSHDDALLAAYSPTWNSSAATPDVGDNAELGIDDSSIQELADRSTTVKQNAADAFQQLQEQLSTALDAAGITLPEVSAIDLPAEEKDLHHWVQTADGPDWVDLDTTITGAQRGDALATIGSIATEVASDLVHTVNLRVVAEEAYGGLPVRRDVISYPIASSDVSERPLTIGVSPPSSMAAVGLSINELFSGQAAFYPYIAIGSEIVAYQGTPLVFTSDAEGILDALGTEGEGPADGELLALFYAVDVTSPGRAPLTIERPIFDRLDAAARLSDAPDLTTIPKVTLDVAEDGTAIAPDLAKITLVSIGVGDISPSYAMGDGSDVMSGFSIAGSIHSALTGTLLRDEMLPRGVHAFAAYPQIAAFTLGSSDVSDPASSLLVSADLLDQQRGIISADGTMGSGVALHPAVRVGVLSQVAEGVVLRDAIGGSVAEGTLATGATVGDVFAAAAKGSIPIVVLSDASDPVPAGLSEDGKILIADALAAGLIVIVPENSVTIDDRQLCGWWTIDPATGVTKDMMDNGQGYASVEIPSSSIARFQSATEEGAQLKEVNTWMPWYRRLGRCVGMAAMIGAAVVDVTGINPGTFTTTGALKAALKAYMKRPGIGKDLQALADCY